MSNLTIGEVYAKLVNAKPTVLIAEIGSMRLEVTINPATLGRTYCVTNLEKNIHKTYTQMEDAISEFNNGF